MKKIAFTTLGCKLNFAETAAIARRIEGMQQVPFDQPADVYAINSCTVTSQAEKKLRDLVKRIKKRHPRSKVVVFGCYAQRAPHELTALEQVDLVLDIHNKYKLNEYLTPLLEGKLSGYIHSDGQAPAYLPAWSGPENRTRAFLKIQDGCDYPCSYCIIPTARGKGRNPSVETIVEQARQLAGKGIREIILTGVNIGTFRDGDRDFLALIRALDRVDGIDRYRISSIEPNLLTDDIIHFVLQDSRAFLPHFHIPLQSGCNHILGRMRRRYRREIHLEKVEKIKSLAPHAAVGADVIVGFPGETDAYFRQTYSFLKDSPVTYLHVFPYSDRPGTVASQMDGKVSGAVKKERSQRLRELSARKTALFVQSQLGRVRPVLFEKKVKNGMQHGWTDNYIDVAVPAGPNLAGRIGHVKLTDWNQSHATGEIIDL